MELRSNIYSGEPTKRTTTKPTFCKSAYYNFKSSSVFSTWTYMNVPSTLWLRYELAFRYLKNFNTDSPT